MNSLEIIKAHLQKLYETQPNVHINVTMNKPKVRIVNEPVVLTGCYRNIFQIEEYSCGYPKCYTLQYTDILTKQVEILELDLPDLSQ